MRSGLDICPHIACGANSPSWIQNRSNELRNCARSEANCTIHLGPCLEAVRLANRSPESDVFEYRPLEKTGRRANAFLS